jgi:starch phosphorylase
MIERDLVCGIPIDTDTAKYKREFLGRTYYFCSERCANFFSEGSRIAYFSMEVGIRSDIPTYSGGLGVLAGDTIRSSADLKIPLAAVTLISRKGYFRQKLSGDGEQVERPEEWYPPKYARLMPPTVTVNIEGRDVKVRSWLYEHQSTVGSIVPVLFLDTDVEGNAGEDRRITDVLYGGDDKYRLKQEIVLGIGGVRMLDALGLKISKYHMNEGHSSLLAIELLKKEGMDAEATRSRCIFTTHTPVGAAMDNFSYDMIRDVLTDGPPHEVLKEYAGHDRFNMAYLALNLSRFVNGVTKAHMEESKKLFPGYHIHSITNGVHSSHWTCRHYRELYDKHIPGWANEPELLVRAAEIPIDEIWEAHMKAKIGAINTIKERTGIDMDVNVLTLGFARRATAYKRAALIFSDLKKLKEVSNAGKIQLVFAGKAHPNDKAGKRIIREIFDNAKKLKGIIKVAYLENYEMDMAAVLTSGVDVWLNTPLPPYEASGTSGMKAAHNGILNFSVLDGWWIEGCIEEVTGWSIGPSPAATMGDEERRARELSDLYNKLEYLILPKFYNKKDDWIYMMRGSISKIAYFFNSHRMMRRYATEAYL